MDHLVGVGEGDRLAHLLERRDQPPPVGLFVGEQVGYLFMGWVYAVTTDGGRTWSVWDASKELPQWRTNYRLIEDVTLGADGTGKMLLNPLEPQPSRPELVTDDFGRHWKAR